MVFLSCGKSTFPRHAPAVRDFMRFDIYWKVSQNVDQASVRYFPIPDWHRHNSGNIIIYSRVAEEEAVGCPLYKVKDVILVWAWIYLCECPEMS